jgi:hypothetical protein
MGIQILLHNRCLLDSQNRSGSCIPLDRKHPFHIRSRLDIRRLLGIQILLGSKSLLDSYLRLDRNDRWAHCSRSHNFGWGGHYSPYFP